MRAVTLDVNGLEQVRDFLFFCRQLTREQLRGQGRPLSTQSKIGV